MPGAWEGGRRVLPADWARIRRRVLERDGHRCTWVTDGQRCSERATDVDHIGDRDDHDDDNLAGLCSWHHDRKSSAQGNAARVRRTERHPTEPHPGLT